MTHFKTLSILLMGIAVLILETAIPQAVNLPLIVWLAWSPDGSKVAVGSDSQLLVKDAATNAMIFEVERFKGRLDMLSWKPDSSRIASIDAGVGIQIWDVKTGHQVAELPTDTDINGRGIVAWSPDGTKLTSVISTDSAPIHLWAVNGDQFTPVEAPGPAAFYDLAWSPDSTRLAVAGISNLYVLDGVSTGKLQYRIVGLFALSVAWSPDGTKLAGGTAAGNIYITDTKTGQMLKTLNGHQSSVDTVRWLNDNQTLISTSVNGSLHIWNTASGEMLKTIAIKSGRASHLFDLSPYEGQMIYAPADEANQHTNRTMTIALLPSIEKLQALTKRCVKPDIQPSFITKLDAKQLPAFTNAIKALTRDQIPPACAADLVAVAEALQAQP